MIGRQVRRAGRGAVIVEAQECLHDVRIEWVAYQWMDSQAVIGGGEGRG